MLILFEFLMTVLLINIYIFLKMYGYLRSLRFILFSGICSRFIFAKNIKSILLIPKKATSFFHLFYYVWICHFCREKKKTKNNIHSAFSFQISAWKLKSICMNNICIPLAMGWNITFKFTGKVYLSVCFIFVIIHINILKYSD